jgi:hypothetical protein
MREVLAELIRRKNLPLDARAIIHSEITSTGVVRYRITLEATWEHWPDPDEGEAPSMSRRPTIPPGLLGSGHAVSIKAL